MSTATNTVPLRHRLVNKTLDEIDFGLAEVGDAEELCGLFGLFFAEAGYKHRGIKFSPDRAEAWLKRVIESGACPHIVARSAGDIIGTISYTLDDTFCEKPVAVLHTLYVVAGHRHSAIGSVLVSLALEMSTGDGACAFHAPLASGMAETASLINLFRKAGFVSIGTILGRSL
jgi:L-amino acid N-acyltransferase YncA